MLLIDFSGGYDYGLSCLKAIPDNHSLTKWDIAYSEVVEQLGEDFNLLACRNGSAMSSIKTHNTYGFACQPDGRGMYYVRFEGESEWHSIY